MSYHPLGCGLLSLAELISYVTLKILTHGFMNWVQSALNGCVPILGVLGSLTCAWPAPDTHAQAAALPPAHRALASQVRPQLREAVCVLPFLHWVNLGSLVPNSSVTLHGVKME